MACTVADALGGAATDTLSLVVGAVATRAIIMENILDWTWECLPAGTVTFPGRATRFDGLDTAVDHVVTPVAGGDG